VLLSDSFFSFFSSSFFFIHTLAADRKEKIAFYFVLLLLHSCISLSNEQQFNYRDGGNGIERSRRMVTFFSPRRAQAQARESDKGFAWQDPFNMLVPVFSLQLSNKVFPRTLAVGKFNGKRPSLVGATAGNKVNFIEMMWIGIAGIDHALGIHSFYPRSQITRSTIRRECHSPQRQPSGDQPGLWTAR
jgi:hypothetical protein